MLLKGQPSALWPIARLLNASNRTTATQVSVNFRLHPDALPHLLKRLWPLVSDIRLRCKQKTMLEALLVRRWIFVMTLLLVTAVWL